MRRYTGSIFSIFAAFVTPAFILGSLVFSIMCLLVNQPGAYFVAIMFLVCSCIEAIYLKKVFKQLYTWAVFDELGIKVKTLFCKPIQLEYDVFNDIGIGVYVHKVAYSDFGSKVIFIYFSSQPFDGKYRTRINLWNPSFIHLKVRFDKKLYNYLIANMPSKYVYRLQLQYQDLVNKKGYFR